MVITEKGKLNNAGDKRGFTLMELLLVVAIIAVLVAIAIPIVQQNLKKARWSVDLANERSAKAAAVADYLFEPASGDVTYYYDASKGKAIKDVVPASGYGKSDERPDNSLSDPSSPVPKGRYIAVTIKPDGTVTIMWVGEGSSGSSSGGSSGSTPFPPGKGGLVTGDGTVISWEDLTAPNGILKTQKNNNANKDVILGTNEGKIIEGNIFSGSGKAGEDITIDFHGTQAQWDSIKGKMGLAAGTYTLNIIAP